MREIHIQEPVWYGDRSNPTVGIAHFRVVHKITAIGTGQVIEIPHKGYIKVWINYQEKKADGLYGLVYPHPFVIECSQVLKYPTQPLNDFRRTIVHHVPISAMREHKERRKRTMPQDQFAQIREQALQIANEERLK